MEDNSRKLGHRALKGTAYIEGEERVVVGYCVQNKEKEDSRTLNFFL